MLFRPLLEAVDTSAVDICSGFEFMSDLSLTPNVELTGLRGFLRRSG